MKQIILSALMLVSAFGLNAQTLKLTSSEGKTEKEIYMEQREEVYQATTIAKNGEAAPDFKAYTADGKEVRLSDFKGKVVHISFWATWCGPCLKELQQENLPAMIKPFMENPDYVYLPIAQDQKDKFEAFLQTKKGAEYLWLKNISLLDGNRDIFHTYASKFIPRNVIIDRDGKVVVTCIGGEHYEIEIMKSTLEKLLN